MYEFTWSWLSDCRVLPYLTVFLRRFYGFTTTWSVCVTVWCHLNTEPGERQLCQRDYGEYQEACRESLHGMTWKLVVITSWRWFTLIRPPHWLRTTGCVESQLISVKRSNQSQVFRIFIYLFLGLSTQRSQFAWRSGVWLPSFLNPPVYTQNGITTHQPDTLWQLMI